MSEHSPFLSAFLFTQQQPGAEPSVSLPFSFLPSFAAPIDKKITWLFWCPNPILSLLCTPVSVHYLTIKLLCSQHGNGIGKAVMEAGIYVCGQVEF